MPVTAEQDKNMRNPQIQNQFKEYDMLHPHGRRHKGPVVTPTT